MIKTFKRNELKYFVTSSQYEELISLFEPHMSYDSFCRDTGSYMIYNVYFDTVDDAVIRHSLSKPYYKEKLRLRSYEIPIGENEKVFLELKKKIGGIVSKRRAVMTYRQAMDFVIAGNRPLLKSYQDTQVVMEIEEFLSRYRVFPKVYISYERTAFFGNDDKDFRVSFDHGILTRRSQVSLSYADLGKRLLPSDMRLMEIKCSESMPLWLTGALSSMKIFKTSFSKYGTEYKSFYESNTNYQAS